VTDFPSIQTESFRMPPTFAETAPTLLLDGRQNRLLASRHARGEHRLADDREPRVSTLGDSQESKPGRAVHSFYQNDELRQRMGEKLKSRYNSG
jgi:hypothetical protein